LLRKYENGETQDQEMYQIVLPLESIGVYIPGKKANYPSSVLMNIVPAIVAGVKNVYIATPTRNTLVLALAYLCKVKQVYLMGGAHAIAAFAYGTESVKKVDKIVGPGNVFVSYAKRLVYGDVGIDMIAGPSEIVIIADQNSNALHIAYDMLAQSEHDEKAMSILITTSKDKGEEVLKILKTKKSINRQEILDKSLMDYSRVIVVKDIDEAIKLSNLIAPEHLELLVDDALSHILKIKNAGAIFLNTYSPEAIGDYVAGPSHVLPTNGTARFFSPLSVLDFFKRRSVINLKKETFEAIADDAIEFAQIEGLLMHLESIKVRK
jgi:histidinol dehydrogenase